MSVDLSTENDISVVTINRPEALNAFDWELLADLDEVLCALAKDERVAAVIITGVGDKAFCVGGDIEQMRETSPEEAHLWGRAGHATFRRLRQLPHPTIAAVNGAALGAGCEVAAACDIRLASEKAKFGHPEVGLGIMPGWGGTQLLPRIVGLSRAKEMIISGRVLGAEEALAAGLVSRVVPAESLMQEALQLARTIATKGPSAVRRAKLAIDRGLDTDLETGCELEASFFALCFGPEQREGMAAFLERRPPSFSRRKRRPS